MPRSQRRTQKLTIIAKDPSVKIDGKILTAQVDVPAEDLAPGPRGYRVQVIDYDASMGILYPPLVYRLLENGQYNDPFKDEDDETLLGDPSFHAQNVYAIVMRTLTRFEHALGRRVSWSFGGHQLQVAPHAFGEANAFYSKDDRSLLFGYFRKLSAPPSPSTPSESPKEESGEITATGEPAPVRYKDMVFTCLSHDVVAHETTHALVDGLRERYTDPSSPDQAGFHEGFADVVALLSILSLETVVTRILDAARINGIPQATVSPGSHRIPLRDIAPEKLKKSLLFGLGEEIGREISGREELSGRDKALRRSITLEPQDIDQTYEEPHRRGEILVASIMRAFLAIWTQRIKTLADRDLNEQKGAQSPDTDTSALQPHLDRSRVVEDGFMIADRLLTMAIRALDYCPPTDLVFGDFLSALLTADQEMRPDDSKFQFRKTLRESFASYRIIPTSKGDIEPGTWEPPDCELTYERTHFDSLSTDENEMFRFIWENRSALGLDPDAYTRVISVRPCVRINADDGFVLRETVAEYYQILNVVASELKHVGIKKPSDMPGDQHITLYGGGTLIFDDFGRVKYHIRNRILNPDRQRRRLEHLWQYGHFQTPQILEKEAVPDRRFAQMHQQRFMASRLEEGVQSDDI